KAALRGGLFCDFFRRAHGPAKAVEGAHRAPYPAATRGGTEDDLRGIAPARGEPSMTQRVRLRPREIAFALAVGAVAAGGAAFVYTGDDDEPARTAAAATLARAAPAALAPFDSVATLGPQDVVLSIGPSHAVRIEDGDLAERYSLSVEDGVLTIRPREGLRRGFGWGDRLPTVYVTAPQL